MRYSTSYSEAVRQAELAIREKKPEEAVRLYNLLVKRKPFDVHNYSRLMMLFRRLKQPRKELEVIRAGIRSVMEWQHKQEEKYFGKKPIVKRLSRAIMKSLGLLDRKGRYIYDTPIIEKWRRREALVRKKIDRRKK